MESVVTYGQTQTKDPINQYLLLLLSAECRREHKGTQQLPRIEYTKRNFGYIRNFKRRLSFKKNIINGKSLIGSGKENIGSHTQARMRQANLTGLCSTMIFRQV